MDEQPFQSPETAAQAMTVGEHVSSEGHGTQRRISMETIESVVHQIAERFQPERVILFGSYAYGQPGSESDVDLLVVTDTPLKETEEAVRICRGIEYHFALDLSVLKPATMARRLAIGDPFLREVTAKGKVLYERTGR